MLLVKHISPTILMAVDYPEHQLVLVHNRYFTAVEMILLCVDFGRRVCHSGVLSTSSWIVFPFPHSGCCLVYRRSVCLLVSACCLLPLAVISQCLLCHRYCVSLVAGFWSR